MVLLQIRDIKRCSVEYIGRIMNLNNFLDDQGRFKMNEIMVAFGDDEKRQNPSKLVMKCTGKKKFIYNHMYWNMYNYQCNLYKDLVMTLKLVSFSKTMMKHFQSICSKYNKQKHCSLLHAFQAKCFIQFCKPAMLLLANRTIRLSQSVIPILSPLQLSNHHYSITHSKQNQLQFDVITTAQDGQKWMKNIKNKISKYNKRSTKTPHYCQELSHVNDEIWFGVDTEFSQNRRK